MVFFFGLLAQELLEEMMPGGALHHRRRWPVPLVAAAGGTLGAPRPTPPGSNRRQCQ